MTFWQQWSTVSSNLIDEFATETDALAAVRWRNYREGIDAVEFLSPLRFDDSEHPHAGARGSDLLALIAVGLPSRLSADD